MLYLCSWLSVMNLLGLCFCFMLFGLYIMVGMLVCLNSLFLVLNVIVLNVLELFSSVSMCVVLLFGVVVSFGYVLSGCNWMLVLGCIVCIFGNSLDFV